MGEITLSNEEMQRIRVVNSITKVDVIDCVETDDKIVFVIRKGFLGMAIGKDAKNLEKLRTLFKKGVRFVEFDQDEKQFIINLFKPFQITNMTIERVGERVTAKVEVPQRDKSKIIGKNGKNVQLIRLLAKRHSSVEDIQIL
ncbi:MAG TPA: NusA-like transcription termination signal-binding factor [Thermoplasmatales archaeon]|nr:NusA-like transcription termination signal-binding factor [Thermoplasmatales archaeon]